MTTASSIEVSKERKKRSSGKMSKKERLHHEKPLISTNIGNVDPSTNSQVFFLGDVVINDNGQLELIDTRVKDSTDKVATRMIPGIRYFPRTWDFLSILFWSYVLLQLFAFDVPTTLLYQSYPNLIWIAEYRFVVWLILIAMLFMFLRRAEALLTLVYVAFFPLILTLWRTPKLILRQKHWEGTFAILSLSMRFYGSLRYHAITFSLWVTAILLATSSSNSTFLVPAIAVLLSLIVVGLGHRLRSVLRTDPPHDFVRSALYAANKRITAVVVENEYNKLISTENLDESRLQKYQTNLEWSFIYNRFVEFLAKEFRKYQRSS